MKSYTKLVGGLLSIILVVAVSQKTFAQDGIHFHKGTWAEAVAKAKKENKMIFVDAYAKWCGPCKWMAANVFTMPAVGNYYNSNFVNVKMDMEVGEGRSLARAWGIRAYPTLIYFDPNGKEKKRHVGMKRTGEDLINLGKSAGS